jgi:uncharacterized repeat protein (TIGR01451 family)
VSIVCRVFASAALIVVLVVGQVPVAPALASTPGKVVAWGFNSVGQTNVPAAALTGVTAVAGGFDHSLALKDGIVLAWERGPHTFFGETVVPPGLAGVTAIAAGAFHNLALSNGAVVAWGFNAFEQSNVPAEASSGVTAIAGGFAHSLALKQGTVVGWGCGAPHSLGQCTAPTGLTAVTAIAAGAYHSLALRDGMVVAWGWNSHGQLDVPDEALSGVSAISGGYGHSLAVKDGHVIAWGCSGLDYGQCDVPTGLAEVTAIAAGYYHSIALKSDGTIVAWGNNGLGALNVPPAALSGVTDVAAGASHNLAIVTAGAAGADLSVMMVDAPNPVIVGSPLSYTVTVTNLGPGSATGVALSDVLPAGVTFGSATAPCSAPVGGTVACNLGVLASGGSATVVIVVTPNAAGAITNTASVSAGGVDPNTANNTAARGTTVTTKAQAETDMLAYIDGLYVDGDPISNGEKASLKQPINSTPSWSCNQLGNFRDNVADKTQPPSTRLLTATQGETLTAMVRAIWNSQGCLPTWP